MSDHTSAIRVLLVNGLAIGSLYASLLVLARRYIGPRGLGAVATVMFVFWGSVLLNGGSRRFDTANWLLRVALLICVVAVTVIPPLAVARAAKRPPASLLRSAVYGLGGFFLAIVGSLVVGVPIVVAGMRFDW